MKVLVTGGAGFIGSHLCEKLLNQKNDVICVDNFITGSKKNIETIRDRTGFRLIEHDICRPLKIETPVDFIFQLASPASPIDYLELPLETLKVGAFGTYNMLELAREKNAGILLASTSEVYGDPLEHPQNEKYWGNVNPIGPRSVYDEAKRYAEAMTAAYRRKFKLNTRIIRIFNTYGPRMRINDGRVVPTFINQALHGEPLTIFGDGTQTRSFCFVNDLVEGILKMAASNFPGPVNLGNPTELSILEFAERINKLTGKHSELVFKELPQNDPKVRRPDISLAKEKLLWEPIVPLNEGLKQTIEYFQNN